MKCPACGHENTDESTHCTSCGRSFDSIEGQSSVPVRLSRLAIAAMICALVAPVGAMFLGMTIVILRGSLSLKTGADAAAVPLEVAVFVCVVLLAAGFVLGLISLVRIGISGGRLTGRGFAVTGVTVPLAFVALALAIAFREAQRYAAHCPIRCSTNLSGIAKAMLIYANDYDDKFPAAGGAGTVWGRGLNDWRADNRAAAFGLDPNGSGGEATIGSSLYLLVKYGDISPKSFVCCGDRRVREFHPRKYGISSDSLKDLWDFGPNPAKHCSYAHHLPYGRYALTTASEPGLAVAADRNPWIEGPRQKAGDFSLFQPDVAPFNGTAEDACQGNTRAHKGDGQNVLYLDSHVEFNPRAYCGIDDDNIYTSWDEQDAVRGMPPQPYLSQPANEFDSLLVNDPLVGW